MAEEPDPSALWDLTPEELQIARLVADGHSNRDVAARLFLSPRTVEGRLRAIFGKLDVSSRVELAALGFATEGASDVLRSRLARFKAPKRVVIGQLPKTGTGKIQKFVLREQLWAGRSDRIGAL